jgi:hypothetical protein
MDYGSYTPIDPDFYEIIDELSEKDPVFRIFYFLPDGDIGEVNGKYGEIITKKDGEFMLIGPTDQVRIDRIIIINGKPGPAYHEYNAFADACLSCKAGYKDPDEAGEDI